MKLREVIVDRKVLEGFKRRALRRYPNERLEIIIGAICGNQAHVYALHDVAHVSRRFTCETEEEVKDFEGSIGSIHTHPDEDAEPSDQDIKDATEEGEKVFGICSIRRKNNRRFIAWGFYTGAGAKLNLVVAEDKEKQ